MDYPAASTQPPVLWLRSGTPRTSARLTITLLPGSSHRRRQLAENLVAVAGLETSFHSLLLFLAAIAPGLNLEPLRQILVEAGFQEMSSEG